MLKCWRVRVSSARWSVGGGRLKDIRAFIEGLYEPDLHAKRVDALAGATSGVMAKRVAGGCGVSGRRWRRRAAW